MKLPTHEQLTLVYIQSTFQVLDYSDKLNGAQAWFDLCLFFMDLRIQIPPLTQDPFLGFFCLNFMIHMISWDFNHSISNGPVLYFEV